MMWLIAPIISAGGALRRVPTWSLWLMVVAGLLFSSLQNQQAWGVYHYYVGSKYFAELGYFDLYECTFRDAHLRRDLRTYEFTDSFPDCMETDFTLERWLEFHRDIQRVGFYPQIAMDKGANMTPTWIAISEALINAGIDLDILVWLDFVVLAIAFNVLIRLIGWRRTGYVALWTVSYFGTVSLLWGHYGQWWWLASALVGMAMIKRNQSAGGALIGLSAMLAVFPAFLMLFHIKNRRALVWFTAGVAIAGGIGMFNSRGLDGYVEFAQNMVIHSSYIRTELCCNSGLAHNLTYATNDAMPYLLCYTQSHDCQPTYENHYPFLAWLMLIPPLLGTPFGVMFAFLTLSGFYWQILSVLAIQYDDERWIRYALAMNAIVIVWYLVDRESGRIYVNWLLYILFVAMSMHKLGVWMWDDRIEKLRFKLAQIK